MEEPRQSRSDADPRQSGLTASSVPSSGPSVPTRGLELAEDEDGEPSEEAERWDDIGWSVTRFEKEAGHVD